MHDSTWGLYRSIPSKNNFTAPFRKPLRWSLIFLFLIATNTASFSSVNSPVSISAVTFKNCFVKLQSLKLIHYYSPRDLPISIFHLFFTIGIALKTIIHAKSFVNLSKTVCLYILILGLLEPEILHQSFRNVCSSLIRYDAYL